MFIGAINEKLRAFFATHAHLLDGRDCYIGCSGNFSIEQVLTRQAPGARLHSNDVSLYSCILGAALLGNPTPLRVVNENVLWLQEYLDRGPAESVAALLLVMEAFKYEKQNSPHAKRMWEAYLAGWDTTFAKSLAKVQRGMSNVKIAEYTAVDVHDFYPRPDGVSIGFLPTYEGGYEKLFERLEESVEWPKPAYQMLTAERREETVRRMTAGDFILYDDRERDDLPCVAKVDLFGKKSVFIFSNLPFPKGLIRRRLREKDPRFDLLMPDEEIDPGAEVTFTEVEQAVIDHYRAMYLSKKIQPGSGGPCFLVFAGRKLFGFVIFQGYSKMGDRSSIYMLSDFVVPSTRYKRLAKLLVMATLCGDVRRMLEEKSLNRLSSVYTTAFTEHPVSMKYRGVYELAKRGKDEKTGKQFLNYQGKFNDMSLKEVVEIWRKKHKS
ncbi:MAG: hypothetical protein HZA22_04590 [Nitrospirae bacterium]|nr:hypothetical protein [Nitrospirota bacterium]